MDFLLILNKMAMHVNNNKAIKAKICGHKLLI